MKWSLLFLLFLTEAALAGAALLSWTPPTQNTDATLLTDLAGYKLYRGDTAGGPYPDVIDITNPATTSYSWENLPEGRHFFVATAYNEAGLESDYSGEAFKDVLADPVIPNPPTDLTVEQDNSVVYAISKIYDDMYLTPVGTVAAGTPCKTSSVNGKYVVDRQYVDWSSTNFEFAVVVADGCQ